MSRYVARGIACQEDDHRSKVPARFADEANVDPAFDGLLALRVPSIQAFGALVRSIAQVDVKCAEHGFPLCRIVPDEFDEPGRGGYLDRRAFAGDGSANIVACH